MKIRLTALLLAVALLAAGCVNVKAPEKIYIGPGPDRNDEEDKDDETSSRRSPSQLPSVGGGSWKDVAIDIAGQLTLGAEHGAIFYTYDTLAYPGKPVMLAARLQSARNLRMVEGATIGFYKGSELIGTAKTDEDGHAVLDWTPPKEGNYSFTAEILKVPDDDLEEMLKITPAPLLVAARDKSAAFVVIDLDHTVVDSSFWRVLTFGARPMADSARVTKRIAGRYSIIYLTHRPDLLTRKSKNWLTDHGYPAGPLMVSELKDAFGDSGKFKTAKLSAVRKSFPNVRIGIGDKPSDAQAYVDNGLIAYLIPDYKDKPKDMRKKAKEIRGLRDRGRLHVVYNWRQVEAGVFQDRKFPPMAFVSALEREADRLEAEEKSRKRKDDDDDD